jgi:hypothetical protein
LLGFHLSTLSQPAQRYSRLNREALPSQADTIGSIP